LRLGERVRDHGIDAPGLLRAARDLLLRRNPRLAGGEALRRPGESVEDCARRAVLALDGSVLAIQGPPGTGKTYTGARMILDLIRAGKKVGITACSHKVIRKLLDEVVDAAAEAKVRVRCVQRVDEDLLPERPGIDVEGDTKKAVRKMRSGAYDV